MGLTLRHIEVIRAVLQEGSVTGAARLLSVSQPALSRTLKNAESRIGVQIFERRAGRMSPTPEALALQRDIERVYREVESVARTSADLRNLRSGRLEIACNPSVALTLVAAVLGELTATSPDVRVSIQTALNYEVLELVRSRGADIGLAWDIPRQPDIAATEIGQSRLVCLLPQDHPLAAKRSISAKDLHNVPLISFNSTLPIGVATESAFSQAGATRRIGIDIGQTFVAAALARAGACAGIAIVDQLSVRTPPAGLVTRPFTPRRMLKLFSITRPEQLSLVARHFADRVAVLAREAVV
jgi:DNA-binding transcriptional LysR family regulator